MRVNNIVPKHFFCHDMAFYLFDKITSENLSTEQTGYFFRTDRESFGKQNYIALNMDISLGEMKLLQLLLLSKRLMNLILYIQIDCMWLF